MSDKLFFDTTILNYAVDNDPDRSPKALASLSRGGSISVQVLDEFTNTARRKLNRSWDEIVAVLHALRIVCQECLSITEQTHDIAVGLLRRYGYHFYDALIVASALEADCTMLVTEDLQDGQRIEGRLTIHNPFRR